MQLDTDEVTVENSMSKSFDQIIKLQLDPVWNQLVGDAQRVLQTYIHVHYYIGWVENNNIELWNRDRTNKKHQNKGSGDGD